MTAQRDNDGYIYNLGSMRFQDGYLLKGVSLKGVIPIMDSLPPIDELQRFNQVGILVFSIDIHYYASRASAHIQSHILHVHGQTFSQTPKRIHVAVQWRSTGFLVPCSLMVQTTACYAQVAQTSKEDDQDGGELASLVQVCIDKIRLGVPHSN